jgi:hypothetical protein
VEAEVFKKLGVFEVRGALRRSNKFDSLDDVVRDVYRGDMELMVPRVLWKSESTFLVLLKISWLQRFKSKNGEDLLQKLKSKTHLMLAKTRAGLKETISIVGQEEELDKICFMGKDVNSSSFSQPRRKTLYVVISSSPHNNTQRMFNMPAAYRSHANLACQPMS